MKKKFLFIGKVNVVVFIIINLFITQFVLAQKFTIAVIPDSQYEISTAPTMFTSQMQWLATKKDSLKLPIVLHVGDMVNSDNADQFVLASAGYKILDDASLDYANCLGNHDTGAVNVNNGSAAPGNTRINLRITEKFNTYFPVTRFAAQKGRYQEGKSDNAFYTFKAGGLDWLVLTLELCARQEIVAWANTIIPMYPHHNVIILTHYHLNSGGVIATDNVGYGNLTSKAVYDQLISKYANVRFVFSGHVGASKKRDDIGLNGNHIYQLLQDFSSENYGNGYIRLLDIDPGAGTISAKMYSPYLNSTKNDYSKFSFSGVEFVPAEITGIGDKVTIPANSLKLNLFTNPSLGDSSAEILSTSNEDATLTIFSMSGEKISSSKMKIQSNIKSKVDLQKLGFNTLYPGIYLLSAHQGTKSASQKIIVN